MPDIIITPSSGLIDFFPVSTRVGRIEGSGNTINVLNPSGYVAVSGSGMSINTSAPNALLHAYSSISGATILNLEGTNGSLFSVVDNLSGSLMSVNNNAGLPVFEVFSDDRVIGGRFGQNDWIITSGGNIGIGTGVPNSKFHVVGTSTFNGDISSTGSIIAGSGSAANPSFEFVGDVDTGMFAPAANTIALSTSGVERVRIDNIGNVGIGNSPQNGFKLDVQGASVLRGQMNIGGGIVGQSTDFSVIRYNLSNTANNNSYSYVCNGGGNFGVGFPAPSGRVAISGGASIGSNYNLTPPTNGLIIEGNVGIGTSTPTGQLHVIGTGIFDNVGIGTSSTSVGATSYRLLVDGDVSIGSGNATRTLSVWGNNTTKRLLLKNVNGNSFLTYVIGSQDLNLGGPQPTDYPFNNINYYAGSNNGFHRFHVSIDGTGTNPVTVITSSGIGIVTQVPSSLLDISGSVSNNASILIRRAGINSRVYLGAGNSDTDPFLSSVHNGDLSTSTNGFGFFDRGTDGNLQLQRKSSSSSWTSALIIDRGNGNVGIGTGVLSPVERLVVDGNLRLADTATSIGNRLQLARGGGTAYDYTLSKEGNHLAISTASDSGTNRAVQIGYHSGSTWTPQIHINAYAGTIGVRTTSPSAQLHVVGSGFFASGLTTNGLISNLSSNFYLNNSFGNTFSINYGTNVSPYGTVTIIPSGTNPGTTNIVSQINGTNTLYLPSSNGNIALISDINTTQITGILSVSKGGTNTSTYSNGQLLIGSGTSLTANTLTQGDGITITNGSGTISLAINNTVVRTSGNQTVSGVKTFANQSNFSSGIKLQGNNVDLNLDSGGISSTDGASITITDNLSFLSANTIFTYYSAGGEDIRFYDGDSASDILKITDRVAIRSPNGSASGTYFPVWTSNPNSSAQPISSKTASEFKNDIGLGNVENIALSSANINTSQITGVLPISKGGTNRSTYSNGQLLIGSGTSLAANTLTASTGISIANGSGTITIATTGLANYDVSVLSLGTVSGTNAINCGQDRQIQNLTLNGVATTFTKGNGWPTSDSVARETTLNIFSSGNTSVTWTIVNDWYRQPDSPLPSGRHIVLLRSIGSGTMQGHYIGNKTN